MNPISTISKIAASLVCVITMCSDCYDPSLIRVPVTVPETRQKQNHYYTPTSHNMPLLTGKNDRSGSIQYALGSRHTGVEAQAAYLPVSYFGLTASYSSGFHDGDIFKYHHITAGAGYVIKFNEYWNVEVYAGYSYGKIDNIHSTGYSSIKTNGFFAQPAFFYYDRKKNLQVALITKLSVNQFNITNASFSYTAEPYTADQFDLLRRQSLQVFLEQE